MSLQVFIGTASKGETGRYGYAAILKYGEALKEIPGVITMATEKQAALAAALAACNALKRQVDMKLFFSDKEIVAEVSKAVTEKSSPQSKNERDSKLWAGLIGNSYQHNMEAGLANEDAPELKAAFQAAMQKLNEEDASSDCTLIDVFIGSTEIDKRGVGGYAAAIHNNGNVTNHNGCISEATGITPELTAVLIALKHIEAGTRVRFKTTSARLADEISKRIADGYTTHLNDGNKIWTDIDNALPNYRIEILLEEDANTELARTAQLAKGAIEIMDFVGGETSKLEGAAAACVNE